MRYRVHPAYGKNVRLLVKTSSHPTRARWFTIEVLGPNEWWETTDTLLMDSLREARYKAPFNQAIVDSLNNHGIVFELQQCKSGCGSKSIVFNPLEIE